jgi:hypothetical protein
MYAQAPAYSNSPKSNLHRQQYVIIEAVADVGNLVGLVAADGD